MLQRAGLWPRRCNVVSSMTSYRRTSVLVLVALAAGCASGPGGAGGRGDLAWDGEGRADGFGPDGADDDDGDVLVTRLAVDLASQSGRAEIEVVPSEEGRVALEVGGLEVRSLTVDGEPVEHTAEGGRLEASFPEAEGPVTLVIEYGFSLRNELEGATPSGLTLTWPYYCGNLFPCQSDPAEGCRYELELGGTAEGLSALYPREIPAEAPAYMLAWAVGAFDYTELGTTAAGTRVGVYHSEELAEIGLAGTRHLVQAFEWYETTLGPYPYGAEVAAVPVEWGGGAFGGMEHHPYWHVARGSFGDEDTQIHEAGHGWFGNGVRIRCWEDFVLSEGTVSYLTARALEAVAGAAAGEAAGARYESRLRRAQATAGLTVAWPGSCGEVDILEDGLFTSIPYMKGAFFFRALERRIGRESLDAALRAFYLDHVGRAAGMQDLLDRIHEETGYDPTACAAAWLQSETIPQTESCE